MSKRIALLSVLTVAVAGLAVGAATASPKKHTATKASTSSHLLVGINDEPDTLYGESRHRIRDADDAEDAGACASTSTGAATSGPSRTRSRATRPIRATRRTTGRSTTASSSTRTPTTSRSSSRSSSRRPGPTAARRSTVAPTNAEGPPELRVCRCRALQRPLDPAELAAECVARHRQHAAPEGDDVDGLERAEQPALAHAAVQAGRQDVARRERVPVREDLQRGLQRRPLGRSSATGLQGEQVACGVTGPKGNDAPKSSSALRRPAHLPHRGEEVRDEELRRLRASSVRRQRAPRRRATSRRAHTRGGSRSGT